MATKLGGSFHAQTSVQRDKRFILLMEPMNTENRDEIEAVLSLVTRPRVLRLKKGVHLPEETYEGDWKIGERFISSRCGTSPNHALLRQRLLLVVERGTGGEDADSDSIFPFRAEAEGGRLYVAKILRPSHLRGIFGFWVLSRSSFLLLSGAAGPRRSLSVRPVGHGSANLGRAGRLPPAAV